VALVTSCASDDDCTGEIRGELWTDLDGRFRFRNRHAPTDRADGVAMAWLGGGCASGYDLLSVSPLAMCRAGRCVERPPAPVPEDWVRVDMAGVYTFFAPPQIDLTMRRNCTGGLGSTYRSEGLTIHVDYDNDLHPPAGARETTIGQERALFALREGVQDETAVIDGQHEAVAFFPDAPACPLSGCWGSGKGSWALKVVARGHSREDLDRAAMLIRSVRRW
jgi:hypothetical protein